MSFGGEVPGKRPDAKQARFETIHGSDSESDYTFDISESEIDAAIDAFPDDDFDESPATEKVPDFVKETIHDSDSESDYTSDISESGIDAAIDAFSDDDLDESPATEKVPDFVKEDPGLILLQKDISENLSTHQRRNEFRFHAATDEQYGEEVPEIIEDNIKRKVRPRTEGKDAFRHIDVITSQPHPKITYDSTFFRNSSVVDPVTQNSDRARNSNYFNSCTTQSQIIQPFYGTKTKTAHFPSTSRIEKALFKVSMYDKKYSIQNRSKDNATLLQTKRHNTFAMFNDDRKISNLSRPVKDFAFADQIETSKPPSFLHVKDFKRTRNSSSPSARGPVVVADTQASTNDKQMSKRTLIQKQRQHFRDYTTTQFRNQEDENITSSQNKNGITDEDKQEKNEYEIADIKPLSKMKSFIKGKSSYDFSEREENIFDCGIVLKNETDRNSEQTDNSADVQEEQIKQLHYHKGISKKITNCADIKLFQKYYILSINNKIEKRDRATGSTVEHINVEGAGRMCSIKDSKSVLAVIQTCMGIVCFETNPQLVILYKIITEKQYVAFCHIETSPVDSRKQPNPSHTFVASLTHVNSDINSYKQAWRESLFIVQSQKDWLTRYRNDHVERHKGNRKPVIPYKENAKTAKLYGISEISSIESVWGSSTRYIIIGCNDKVVCIRYKDFSLVWEMHLQRAATDVGYMQPHVLVCIQDDLKILAIDIRSGKITDEHVLETTKDSDKMPHKLSVCGKSVLLKCYIQGYYREPIIVEYDLSDKMDIKRRQQRL